MVVEEKNKIKEIVDILKKDGVDAGKSEAERIISEAKEKATEIVNNANKEKEKIVQNAKNEIEKLQNSAQANIRMAITQGVNQFKEAVEKKVLKPSIITSLEKAMDPQTVKDIILTVVNSYAKTGFSINDLNIILGEKEKEQIKSTILTEIKSKVSNAEGVKISDDKIPTGVKLIQKDKNLLLEFTPESISEVLLSFIRPEFRKIFFEGEKK